MNKAVYRHVFSSYGKLPGWWLGVVTEIIRTTLLRIIANILLAKISADIVAGNIESATNFIVIYIVSNIFAHIIGSLGDVYATETENKKYGELSVRYYRQLTSKDMSFYRDSQTGYLTSLFRQHLDSVILLVRLLRGEIIRTAISLTLPVIVLSYLNLQIGLIALGIVIVQLIYISWVSKKVNKYRAITHEVYRKLSGAVSDEITNIIAFKSKGKEEASGKKIASIVHEETTAYSKRRRVTILLDLPRAIITTIAISAGFYIIMQHSSGDATAVGLLVLTMTYLFQINRNVMDVPDLLGKHDDLITQAYPTLVYMSDEFETIKDPRYPKEFHSNNGTIVLKAVSFSYNAYDVTKKPIQVFDQLNMTIQGGEHIGVVGLSGAGKSTLASLLMRFDDVTDGSIIIDGQDVRDVKQSNLRRRMAYVPQEPLLFHRTVKENIEYFKDGATDADIIKAAKAAHAHEFIQRLPNGYNTIVGERGVKLSGGQKQRIVIARSILKNASIMIFDEATSALDSESEAIIQAALPKIMGKHTAVVIAHRLSTVAPLDRIIVMHEGKIEETGTHDELLQKKGRYYALWQRQISGKEYVSA